MKKNIISSYLLAAVSLILPLQGFAESFDRSDTSRVSAGTYSGAPETNGASTNARMSKNGRFVVFESVAGNLVSSPAVTPGRKHCYLYDRQADQVELVSLTLSGTEIDSDCLTPSVSNDGRYVAFASAATVASTVDVCANGCHVNQAYAGTHIWVRDRLANQTMLISQASLPVKRQQLNADTLQPEVKVDTGTGNKVPVLETVTRRIAAVVLPSTPSVSSNPRISADGRYVIYDTNANNLILDDDTPEYAALVSGVDYNAGTGIVFSYLTTFFLPSAYYADGNGVRDAYIRDGSTFTNRLVSLSCQFHDPGKCGIQGTNDSVEPVMSDDSQVIAFSTTSRFLDLDFNGVSDIYLVERSDINGEVSKLVRISNNTTRIVAANGASTKPALSADGRFVAFQSAATNIVTNDTNGKSDVFVFDRTFNRMIMCSKPSSGLADQDSTIPDISGAGEFVTFQSTSTSFGISSGVSNIYMGTITKGVDGDAVSCSVGLISKGTGLGSDANATVANVGVVPRSSVVNGTVIRAKGASVSYQTSATNISTDSDSNGVSDIFQAPVCTEDERNTDTDGDGTSNCFDQCANDPIAVESDDTDADGVPDCEDGCSEDPLKVGPGACGCSISDTDTDSDGSADCIDQCDNDPNKTAPGDCGCGLPDTDANGNGTSDCKESTNPTTPVPVGTATPVATATPTFNLTTYKPNAPVVRRTGKLKANVTIDTSNATDQSKIKSFYLVGRRLSASAGKIRIRTTYVKDGFIGGEIKFRAGKEGRYTFTIRANGDDDVRSLESDASREVNIR
jgi:Tol biopolymer transport system component